MICKLLSNVNYWVTKKLIKKVIGWKRQGRWNNIAPTNRFLIHLFFCNCIKVLWPNAFNPSDIICAFRNRKEELLELFNTYDTTEDSDKNTLELTFLWFIIILCVSDKIGLLVFSFLRLVVDIQICSHRTGMDSIFPGSEEILVWKMSAFAILRLQSLDIQSQI